MLTLKNDCIMRNVSFKKSMDICLCRVALVLLLLSPAAIDFSVANPLQDRKVSGTVVSEADGEPLIGVSVYLKGNEGRGVITDLNGRYSLTVPSGATLVFSYVGYVSQEIEVKGSVVNVQLKEDSELLDEVVVVGYGTMKRSDLTGSVVSVGEDEIKQSVITSLDQALQGRAAGVQVTQNSGAPGGGISVSIRGINSLNGNEPLYVIFFNNRKEKLPFRRQTRLPFLSKEETMTAKPLVNAMPVAKP